jgi:ATP-dependent DNA helicase DinG
MTPTEIQTVPTSFAEAEERLAATLPGYESRDPQRRLAEQVEQAIDADENLLAEAGCGTGKSFGILIPAITSKRRTLVSTGTKALQDQYVKDLTFLQENLGVDFDWTLFKGRSNYLCMSAAMSPDEEVAPDVVASALKRTEDPDFDGERAHLKFDVTDAQWRALTVGGDDCPGKKQCPFGDVCYAEAAKARAATADVTVTNHAMLFTDLKIREISEGWANMLGDLDVVMCDEIHEAEGYATSALGERLTEFAFSDLSARVINYATGVGDDGLRTAGGDIKRAGIAFFEALPRVGRMTVPQIEAMEEEWAGVFRALDDIIKGIGPVTFGVDAERGRLATRVTRFKDRMVTLMAASPAVIVRYVEEWQPKKGGPKRKAFLSALVNVGTFLGPNLFDKYTTIGVSATVRPFEYIAGRLGVGEHRAFDVGTPFNFAEQARLYVPTITTPPTYTSPQSQRDAWERDVVDQVEKVVDAAGGGTLVLCTSKVSMNKIAAHLRGVCEHTVMCQGDEPNQHLANRFMEDVDSVLVATRSFFTGVDFRGDACRAVVLDKCPFDVPNDPIIEARSDDIEAKGGNPFMEFTIPRMTVVLLQGFGRLIRHRDDRGVVAILDDRLTKKAWGQKIMKSLPNAPLTTDIADVEAFFGG